MFTKKTPYILECIVLFIIFLSFSLSYDTKYGTMPAIYLPKLEQQTQSAQFIICPAVEPSAIGFPFAYTSTNNCSRGINVVGLVLNYLVVAVSALGLTKLTSAIVNRYKNG